MFSARLHQLARNRGSQWPTPSLKSTFKLSSVSGRESLIEPEFKEELYKYITGIVRNQKQKLIAINGVSDHVHILIGLRPAMALADLEENIKTDSSKFINHNKWVHGRFSWQEGYGAFSYGHSQLDRVIRYIQNQEKHHERQSL